MVNSISINDLINLNGRTAVITGSTGNLGCQIAASLAELGADLILTDREGSDYSQVIEIIKSYSNAVNYHVIDCDLENEESRIELIKTIEQRIERLDILINNAAFAGTADLEGWNTNFYQQSLDSWRRAFEVNLTSVFHLSRDLSQKMISGNNGSIINIGSIYASHGPDYSLYDGTDMGNPAAYAASKGGLIQFTKWLATTLAPNIRVNSVSPGGVFRNQPESFVRKYKEKTPLARMANNDDIKGVIAFLSSDLSLYITGQDIMLDGGWSIW